MSQTSFKNSRFRLVFDSVLDFLGPRGREALGSIFGLFFTQRAPRLKKFNPDWSREILNPYAWKFQSRIEIFNLDWKFQSRLKISIPTLIIPHNRSLVFDPAWKFQSRLKISIWDWSLESFNPRAKSWIFSSHERHHVRSTERVRVKKCSKRAQRKALWQRTRIVMVATTRANITPSSAAPHSAACLGWISTIGN